MRPVRSALIAAVAVGVTGLVAACDKPNLDETEGGYEEFATPDAAADTGQIAPHEGPAPGDPEDATGAAAEH